MPPTAATGLSSAGILETALSGVDLLEDQTWRRLKALRAFETRFQRVGAGVP